MRRSSVFIFGAIWGVLSIFAQRPEPPTFRPQPPELVRPAPPAKPDPHAPPGKQAANLAWKDPNIPPADSFSIYRAEGECVMYKELTVIKTGVKASPWVDSTIKPNRIYCYSVSATYKGIESAQSNTVTATPPAKK